MKNLFKSLISLSLLSAAMTGCVVAPGGLLSQRLLRPSRGGGRPGAGSRGAAVAVSLGHGMGPIMVEWAQ
jgi:hypothetical protein